jgi:hypothetical protein
VNQQASPEAASAVEPPRDALALALPRSPEPREWNIVARYLPDSSLRYVRVRVGGAGAQRLLLLGSLALLSLACVALPAWRVIAYRQVPWTSAAALPGLLACVVLFRPLLGAAREARTRLFFWRTLRSIGLGLDRAVFQPGDTFRFEVHLPVVRAVDLHEVQIRLVFWESWLEQLPIPWLGASRRVLRKQGHDLITQTALALQLRKGQHGVVRGEMRVPMQRPTEHHRGKRKHVSYVNLTVTLVATEGRRSALFTGDCPHLITFPWM